MSSQQSELPPNDLKKWLEESLAERPRLRIQSWSNAPPTIRAARVRAQLYLRKAIPKYLREHVTTDDLSEWRVNWEELVPFFGRHAMMVLDAYAELGLKAFERDDDAYLEFLHGTVIYGIIRQILPAESIEEEHFSERLVESGFGQPDGDWEVALAECWQTLSVEKPFDADLDLQWNYDVRWKLRVREHRGPFCVKLRRDLEERSLYWAIRYHETGTSSTTPLPPYPSLPTTKTSKRKALSTPTAGLKSEGIIPTREITADSKRKSSYTFSKSDEELHEFIVGLDPDAFEQLNNVEIERRYRRKAEQRLGRRFPKSGQAFRSALNRIRNESNYPSSKEVGASKKTGQS